MQPRPEFSSERIKPNAHRFVLRSKQLGCPLGLPKVPTEHSAIVSAVAKLNCPDDDSTGQLVAGHVVNVVLAQPSSLFLWSESLHAGVDVDSASDGGCRRADNRLVFFLALSLRRAAEEWSRLACSVIFFGFDGFPVFDVHRLIFRSSAKAAHFSIGLI